MKMIKLTFLVNEREFRMVADKILQTAPGDATPLKKEVTEMMIEKMISGEDERFCTIDPQYTPVVTTKIGTVSGLTLCAIIHKFSELVVEQGGERVKETKEIMEKILNKYK